MNYWINKVLGTFGYTIKNKKNYINTTLMMNFYPDKTINVLYFYLYYLSSLKEYVLVQVGANDGITADPLHGFLKHHNKSGNARAFLIEPFKDNYDKLVNNYKNIERCTFINSAVDKVDGNRKCYYVDEIDQKRYDRTLSGIQSFDYNHLKKHGVEDVDIAHRMVNTVTFSTIFNENNLSKADVLIIDTEGYDNVIIQSYFECAENHPIIYFEHCHLSYVDYKAVVTLLENKQYHMIRLKQDTIAVPEIISTQLLSMIEGS